MGQHSPEAPRTFDELRQAMTEEADPVAQRALACAYVAAQRRWPVIEDGQAILLVLAHSGASVLISGDTRPWAPPAPLPELGASGLFYGIYRFDPDARIDYCFTIDGVQQLDPYNPLTVGSGFGRRSVLRMQEYREPPSVLPRPEAPQGRIETLPIRHSALLGQPRVVTVYLPHGYDPTLPCPTVYFHDGADYLQYGDAAIVLDNLIADRAIPPTIGVFISPADRVVEYDFNLPYRRYIVEELLPLMESRYAAAPDASRRVTIGASYGGLAASWLALSHPELFAGAGVHSGYFSRSGDAIIELVYARPESRQRWYCAVGRYEVPPGGAETEFDLHAAQGRFVAALRERGDAVMAVTPAEGHSWGLWRATLGPMLEFLLG